MAQEMVIVHPVADPLAGRHRDARAGEPGSAVGAQAPPVSPESLEDHPQRPPRRSQAWWRATRRATTRTRAPFHPPHPAAPAGQPRRAPCRSPQSPAPCRGWTPRPSSTAWCRRSRTSRRCSRTSRRTQQTAADTLGKLKTALSSVGTPRRRAGHHLGLGGHHRQLQLELCHRHRDRHRRGLPHLRRHGGRRRARTRLGRGRRLDVRRRRQRPPHAHHLRRDHPGGRRQRDPWPTSSPGSTPRARASPPPPSRPRPASTACR